MTSSLRITFRTLAKSPAFSLTAIAALALGIGANTAIFSVVNQVLLNPTGVSQPERIASLRVKYDKLALKSIGVSVPDFSDVQKTTQPVRIRRGPRPGRLQLHRLRNAGTVAGRLRIPAVVRCLRRQTAPGPRFSSLRKTNQKPTRWWCCRTRPGSGCLARTRPCSAGPSS